MLILLPPSEGKADAGPGTPLDLAGLALPTLRPAREQALAALVELCGQPETDRARELLRLTPGQRGEVLRNADLYRAGTLPAGQLYTGVLYDALDLSGLSAPAYELARRSILICSGLWGVVRIDDAIPPYRCSIGVNLPGVGPLRRHWRSVLPAALGPIAADGPVLDLRSTGYASMWVPDAAVAGRTAEVRVLHERMVNGARQRTTVSHFNKATKGRLVRALLTSGARPGSLPELVTALRDLKYAVEETEPRSGRPIRLDIVVTDL